MERPRRSYAVWEITLACNLACNHCGSRAGKKRADELSTVEALDVVRQLAEVGIEEVTLIGGEAFLRRDWLTIAAAIRDAGMTCTLTTGGYGISAGLARAILAAGIEQVSVSVDGLEATHDGLRGRPGSWRACLASMKHLAQAGIDVACNTQINRLTAPELEETYRVLQSAGMTAWQVQLTVPMGNAADRPEILLQPVELLELFPLLARLRTLADRDSVYFAPGNNIGYYGPYEGQLRPHEEAGQVWGGCHAGLNTLGLEADGTIKGCPSLPTSAYTGGNIREHSLRDIILHTPQLNFNAGASTDHLWGFCQTCTYAKLCRGGCTWTAHVFFDRPGNNPYCHHRALMQAERGIRERLVRTQAPPGVPFDNGVFQLIEEPLQAPWPEDDPLRLRLPTEFVQGELVSRKQSS
jgi:radical SAM protein with 4Fe4S-binding SPASM domain